MERLETRVSRTVSRFYRSADCELIVSLLPGQLHPSTPIEQRPTFPVVATSRVFGVLYRMTLLCFAIITASGVYLFFLYTPTFPGSWLDYYEVNRSVGVALLVQRTHWWASQLFLVLGLATAVAGIATPKPQQWLSPFRRLRLVLLALPVLAVVGSSTGTMLKWDQLALFTVTVGTNMRGFVPMFGDEVKFVLIGGRIVTTNHIITVLAAHILGVAGLSAVALAMAKPRRRALDRAYENEETTEAV